MEISFVLPAFYGTGGINVIYEYARRLKERGHHVTVYVPIIAYNLHRGNAYIDRCKQIYATLKVIKSCFFENIPQKIKSKMQVEVKAVLKINDTSILDADIVIASAWCTAFDVDRLSSRKGKKIYFIQDYEIWDNEKLGKQSYKLSLNKIVIAEWIKQKLIKECHCNKEKITVINNGIDTRIYKPNYYHSSTTDRIVCLMLDHMLEKKGVKYGIEAFYIAKKNMPKLELKMFGMKKSKYVPKEIDYYENPSQEELLRLYQETDIFIFPSLEEGWGLTPVEAMACECAVVGCNVGCMLDIGVDGENVVLCDKANSESLAKGIIKVAMDEEFRKLISRNGYLTVKQLDWEISTNMFERELLRLLNV